MGDVIKMLTLAPLCLNLLYVGSKLFDRYFPILIKNDSVHGNKRPHIQSEFGKLERKTLMNIRRSPNE
ncbi:hypothetical protein Maes01_00254 [Microbulbifer aestuariivivens]|uniref:Transposase DDE domain-containing protein n=1 Tax=Microbulbifer aestuariivivens TaxID=1908308 RepID=A0ABP9WNC2_9GAMM